MRMRRPVARPRHNPTNDITAVMAAKIAAESTGENPSNPKLVPASNKLELRVRGPNVTPGYWKRADLTAAAFDADGFYRPGDAVRFDDPADPAKGLVFDGRVTAPGKGKNHRDPGVISWRP